MKVYVFDLMPYDRVFDEFKADRFLPYPLPGKYFDPEIGARTYEQHLRVWQEMDALGYDGVGLNEHHTTPHGSDNAPNMMIAAAAQLTKRLKFLVLGYLVPMYNPLRLAEEIAMADCMSRGRVIAGLARGTPREYRVFNVPMADSRAMADEAAEIIFKAWTEETFSHQGKFWQFDNVGAWPRPYQQPHPPIWVPFSGSKDTLEWAAERNFPGVIGHFKEDLTDDIAGYYARALARHGHRITPQHLCIFTDAWVADDKPAALREYGPNYLYFQQILWHHGTVRVQSKASTEGYFSSAAFDYIRPQNRQAAALDREKIRLTEMSDIEARVMSGELAFGSAKEVTERLIHLAERAGADSILLNMNLGALPNDAFLEQIRRFGREVLPKLQAHTVTRVPAAEQVPA
jgi:alkanesulfonate monooxygenase SsuD/methylene tetrahydromethanopterin reductase-like flavin-dependent oxidoreductase (luciferase family)